MLKKYSILLISIFFIWLYLFSSAYLYLKHKNDYPFELFVIRDDSEKSLHYSGAGNTISQSSSILFRLNKKTGETYMFHPKAGGWVVIPTSNLVMTVDENFIKSIAKED